MHEALGKYEHNTLCYLYTEVARLERERDAANRKQAVFIDLLHKAGVSDEEIAKALAV